MSEKELEYAWELEKETALEGGPGPESVSGKAGGSASALAMVSVTVWARVLEEVTAATWGQESEAAKEPRLVSAKVLESATESVLASGRALAGWLAAELAGALDLAMVVG